MPTANGSPLSNLSDTDLASALNAAPANSNQYTNAIHSNESNGASDSRADIVNPASGARGSMQVMPATAAKPGYGITPSNGTPEDDARVGREYYNKLHQTFGDPTTAAMAYDWGPGNVQNWQKSGGDLSKLPNETLAYALNFNQKTGAGQNAPQAASSGTGAPVSMDQFTKQFPGGAGPAQPGDDTNPVVAFGAGLGRGVQKGVLGTQSLLGKGLSAIGVDSAGQWLQNDAAQGNTTGQQAFEANGGNTLSGKIGEIGGEVAPALLVPAEIGPQAIGAGVLNAGQASLNGQNIAPAFVEGAGLGAAGATAGHLLGAGIQAAKPLITGAKNAVLGGENAAVGKIADALGDEAGNVATALRANANSAIPGVQRTAAEAANSPVLNAVQRQVQNTPEGAAALAEQQAANNTARQAAGEAAAGGNMGPSADAAFTRDQAARVAQGQQEIAPITEQQAALMQTPEYQSAIRQARAEATNTGSNAFADQSGAINADLAGQLSQVTGTPETLAAARGARAAQAAEDYAPLHGSMVDANGPAFADLEARPGFVRAYREAGGTGANIAGSQAADPFITQAGERSLQMNPRTGELNWVEGPPQRFADAGLLQGARSNLSQMESAARSSGNLDDALGYQRTREALDDFMSNPANVGEDVANTFRNARANYRQNSIPVSQQSWMQQRLAGAVNNLTGEVQPGALNSAINAVQRDAVKPGFTKSSDITPEQLNALAGVGEQARMAPGNMRGLSPQGQEILRQQLVENAAKNPNALQDFNEYLARQSPGYAAAQAGEAGRGAELASRQELAQQLAKFNLKGNNASGEVPLTLNDAKALMQNGNLSGSQRQYAEALHHDLQRLAGANASTGAAGSQTAFNQALAKKGLLGRLIGGVKEDAPLASMLAGEGVLHGLGALPAAMGGRLISGAIKDAEAKTLASTIDLLKNPNKLADALEAYKGNQTAAQTFVNALKQKAARGGKAGLAAVQAYDAVAR